MLIALAALGGGFALAAAVLALGIVMAGPNKDEAENSYQTRGL